MVTLLPVATLLVVISQMLAEGAGAGGCPGGRGLAAAN
jgi:hypothetical protein